MNIPKAIRSLKSKYFTSTTPILCMNRGQPPCNTIAPKQILTYFSYPNNLNFRIFSTQLNRDLGAVNAKQTETTNTINEKLSKSSNITHLSWDSKYNIPVLTANNQNKLIPVTLDVTKQFITQIGIAYTDRWVLCISYWYNGAEHHATINVDHSD